MVRAAMLVAVLMSVLASSEACAEFYKWVDRDGREFITNDKEKIPAQYRDTATSVEVHDDRVSVEKKQGVGTKRPAAAQEHKDKYGRGEQYWRKRAENLRRQLREQQDDLDMIVQQEKDDHGSASKKSRSARAKKKEKIERKIAKLKRELDVDLAEEARKADAYPGWLRE